jgi:chromate transporter
MEPNANRNWREVASLFLKLGCTAFGGPAAHIALMRREIVERRGWIDAQEFLDLVGAVNLVPGPNSTELAIHIGYRRAGWRGFWAAGAAFIAPAFLMVLALAALYARWGTVPVARGVLRGIEPVVIAIILHALWQFFPSAIKNRSMGLLALASLIAVLLGANELLVLGVVAVGGLISASTVDFDRTLSEPHTGTTEAPPQSRNGVLLAGSFVAPALFWSFFKIGAVLYGSGYVLFAFLRAEFVEKQGLISDRQLLDAIAIGQFTPGPLFTSATFVGFQIDGAAGAIAATLGIFAPAFLFVALLATALEKLRKSPRARIFLDAVNAASFALMAATTWLLARQAWNSSAELLWPVALFIASLVILVRTRWNSAWLIAAGAVCGALLDGNFLERIGF